MWLKVAIKFAFSVAYQMLTFSSIQTRPLHPKFGETLQGIYQAQGPAGVPTYTYMESDYCSHLVRDLLVPG